MVFSLVCVLVVGLEPLPVAGDFRLPDAVRGVGESRNVPGDGTAYERLEFEVQPEWVRTVQWLPQGSLGWVQHDLTIDVPEQSLLYTIGTRRGTLGRRLDVLGYSRAEMKVSPLGWLRAMRVQQSRGVGVRRREEAGQTVWSCEVYAGTTLDVFTDPHAGVIIKASLTNPAAPGAGSTYEYMDWRDLPDGTHHPRLVREVIVSAGGRRLEGETRIDQIEGRATAGAPSLPQLPREAIIHDDTRGVVLDGAWNEIARLEPPKPQSANTGRQRWLIAGIVGVLAIAGAVWQKRRGLW